MYHTARRGVFKTTQLARKIFLRNLGSIGKVWSGARTVIVREAPFGNSQGTASIGVLIRVALKYQIETVFNAILLRRPLAP